MLVLTANRLVDGDVVYLGHQNIWVDELKDAQTFENAEAASAEHIGQRAEQELKVIGAYMIEVVDDNGLKAIKLRERIRANGPTHRHDVGKQADRQHAH